jgi:beta-lactamase regulating signal transducer with metallopeptidase domain
MAIDPVWSAQWLWLVYATSLRATALLLLFAAAAALLRRGPASIRALLWAAALLALLPLPAIRDVPLSWSAHVVPPLLARPMIAIGRTLVAQSWPGAAPVPWPSVLGMLWLAGVAVVLGRLVWGWTTLALAARRAVAVTDPEWLALLEDSARLLGVRRQVRLLRAPSVEVPLTSGTLRPAVMLPADSDGWPEVHRRAVLLHELAHVRRLDCLLAILAHAACALWWFHPGAWWAAHRLRVERERACDEWVLQAGVRASDYAECLMRVSDRLALSRGRGPAIVAAGLLWRSQLRARLRAILDAGRPARRAPRGVILLVAASSTALVLAVGSMRLSPRPDVQWMALASPEWTTRAIAAENISRFGDAASVAALGRALREEPNPAVREMARFGARLRNPRLGPTGAPGWPGRCFTPGCMPTAPDR